MNSTLPDGYVVHLPPPKPQPAPPHLFGEPMTIAADLSPTGREQKEKTCLRCGAIRVTVMAPTGESWREWRLSADGPQLEWQGAPECKLKGAKGG
jgi:hypothetical protein